MHNGILSLLMPTLPGDASASVPVPVPPQKGNAAAIPPSVFAGMLSASELLASQDKTLVPPVAEWTEFPAATPLNETALNQLRLMQRWLQVEHPTPAPGALTLAQDEAFSDLHLAETSYSIGGSVNYSMEGSGASYSVSGGAAHEALLSLELPVKSVLRTQIAGIVEAEPSLDVETIVEMIESAGYAVAQDGTLIPRAEVATKAPADALSFLQPLAASSAPPPVSPLNAPLPTPDADIIQAPSPELLAQIQPRIARIQNEARNTPPITEIQGNATAVAETVLMPAVAETVLTPADAETVLTPADADESRPAFSTAPEAVTILPAKALANDNTPLPVSAQGNESQARQHPGAAAIAALTAAMEDAPNDSASAAIAATIERLSGKVPANEAAASEGKLPEAPLSDVNATSETGSVKTRQNLHEWPMLPRVTPVLSEFFRSENVVDTLASSSNTRSFSPEINPLAGTGIEVGKIDLADGQFLRLVKLTQPQPQHHAHQPLADQIHIQIQHAAQGNNGQIRLKLIPEELGSIDISLRMDDNGITHVRILAERGETLDLLQRDRAALEKMLERNGFETGEGNLEFGLEQGSDHAADGQNNDTENNSTAYSDASASGDTTSEGDLIQVGGVLDLVAATGINIRV